MVIVHMRTSRRWATVVVVLLCAVVGIIASHRSRTEIVSRTITIRHMAQDLVLDPRAERLFVASADASGSGILDMIEPTTGLRSRAATLPDAPQALAIAPLLHHLFVSHGVSVSMIDTSNGRLLRTITVIAGPTTMEIQHADASQYRIVTTAKPLTNLIMDKHTDQIFGIVAGGAQVVVIDARTGDLRRVIPVDGNVQSMALDGHFGRLIVTGTSNATGAGLTTACVRIIDTRSFQVLHTVAVPTPSDLSVAPSLDETHARAFISIRPWLLGGPPTLSQGMGRVMAIDTRTGAVLYTTRLNGIGTLVSTDDHSGYTLVAVAQSSRSIGVTTTNSGTTATFSTITPNGPGIIDVLDGRSGRMVQRVKVAETPVAMSVDGEHGRVFVLEIDSSTGRSSVDVIDTRGGHVVQAMPVGAGGGRFAIDIAGRQVAVLTNGGDIVDRRDAWGWVPSWARHVLPFLPSASSMRRHVPASLTLFNDLH